MVLANKIRAKLIASGNNSVQLEKSGFSIVYTPEDAEAIINNPTTFRAGAIGPDNFVFPAMADATHALGLFPFNQCQFLYEAAVNSEERAYALGCFLHGTTDAMAHHLVNYLGGETFTLNPLEANRAPSWENVVEHILAEAMIQSSAVELDPGAFAGDQLLFTVPRGFVQRVYLQETSEAWLLASTHAREKLDLAEMANPGASLLTLLPTAGFGAWEYIVMLPVYLREVDPLLAEARMSVEARLAEMQDPNTQDGADLLITPGPDGVLGTSDDLTDCPILLCPFLFSEYFIRVGLLEPRQDANGNPLPPAFDKIGEKLRLDMFAFQEAYLTTVENVASVLASPIVPGEEPLITPAQVNTAIQPMLDWQASITTIDYETLAQQILPAWVNNLNTFLGGLGFTVGEILQAILAPIVNEINAIIRTYIIDQARVYLEDFITAYNQLKAPILIDFNTKLMAAQNPDLGSTMFENLFDSGLWVNSMNLATVSMANRELVLPEDNRYMGFGPASFDSSHTAAWMQAAVCDYIQPAVFPLGHDLTGTMTVQIGDIVYPAQVDFNSPVECHDGAINMFTADPNATNCALVGVEDLINNPVGSYSRSFPPSAIGETVTCQNIPVDGLPDPPAGGCSCEATGRKGRGGLAWALLLFLPALVLVRRRRALTNRGGAIAASIALLFISGCGDGGGGGGDNPDADLSNPRGVLIAALGNSTWSNLQTRNGIERAYEVHFRADSLLWGELQNPHGPARKREMRQMQIEMDATVNTTVITPTGWTIPINNGQTGVWTLTVTDGAPRMLTIAKMGGDTEIFLEGAWPVPDTGLTAEARVFGSTGAVFNEYCGVPLNGFDRRTLIDFARGLSNDPTLAEDVVAGVPLNSWVDNSGGNNFALGNVPGFDRLGGTESTDQFNFMVRYTGTIAHPGGNMSIREADDVVESVAWAFVDTGVNGNNFGSTNTICFGNWSPNNGDLFYEVHSQAWCDRTRDEETRNLGAGGIPIEIIILRCSETLNGGRQIDMQLNIGGGWQAVGAIPSTPDISDAFFPPIF